MYKSFRVKNFRCFKDLQINDLGRVNLIAGKNNTGKTALMEAMYCMLATKTLRNNTCRSDNAIYLQASSNRITGSSKRTREYLSDDYFYDLVGAI